MSSFFMTTDSPRAGEVMIAKVVQFEKSCYVLMLCKYRPKARFATVLAFSTAI